jgi:chromosome segregation ATPase
MTLVMTNAAKSPAAAQARRALRLQVAYGDGKTRIVDVPAGKVSVGRGARCGLTIDSAGVEPVHCMLSCETDGWHVRAWAKDMQLNGSPVAESALHDGDLITIGLVEMVVVGGAGDSASQDTSTRPSARRTEVLGRSPEVPPPAEFAATTEQPPEPSLAPRRPSAPSNGPQAPAALRPQGDDASRRLRLRCASAVRRGRKLLATLRRDRAERQQLVEQVDGLRRQQAADGAARQAAIHDLHRLTLKLADAEQRLEEHATLVAAHDELQAGHHTLLAAHDELQASHRSLLAEHGELQANHQTLRAGHDELQASYQTLRAGHDELQASHQTLRAGHDELQASHQTLLAGHAQISRKADDLAAESLRLAAARRELEQANESLRGECNKLAEQLRAESANCAQQATERAAEQAIFDQERQCLVHRIDHLELELEGARGDLERANADGRAAVAEVDRLRHETAEQMARAQSDNSALTEQLQQATQERDRLAAEYRALQDRIASLESAQRTGEEELRQLRDRCQGQEATVAAQREQIERAEGERDRYLAETEVLQQEAERLRGEQAQSGENASRLQEANSGLAHQLSQLEQQLGQQAADRDQLVNQLSDLRREAEHQAGRAAAATDEHRVVAEQLAHVQADFERLNQEAQALRAAEEEWVCEKQELAQTRDKLQAEATELRRDQGRTREECARLTNQYRALEKECEQLRNEHTQVWDKVAQLSLENTRLSEANAHSEEDFHSLTAECQQARSDFNRLREEIIAIRDAEEAARNTNLGLSEQLQRAEEELSRLRSELSAAFEEREQNQAESAQLRDEIAAIRGAEQAAQDAYRAISEQIEQAEAGLNDLRSELSKTAAERGQIEQALAESTRDREALRQKLESLEHAALQNSAENSRLLAEHEKFTGTCGELRRENSDAIEKITALKQENGELCRRLEAAETWRQEAEFAATRADEFARQLAESEQKLAELEAQRTELAAAVARIEDHSRHGWQSGEVAAESRDGSTTADNGRSNHADAAARADEFPSEVPAEGCSNRDDAVLTDAPSASEATGRALHESPRDAECRGDGRTVSYIERFAHQFPDDPEETTPPVNGSTDRPEPARAADDSGQGIYRRPRVAQTGSPAPADEESIDQYMAKLLQRIRGDALPPVASAATQTAKLDSGATRAADSGAPNMPAAGIDGELSGQEPAAAAAPRLRSRPAPENAADLKAFRELANESARRAIGVHRTGVHRRSAKWKIVVSAMVGATAGWLMMQAVGPADLQFVSACALFALAAYWAGQSIYMLRESFRAGRTGGQDQKREDPTDEAKSPVVEADEWEKLATANHDLPASEPACDPHQ